MRYRTAAPSLQVVRTAPQTLLVFHNDGVLVFSGGGSSSHHGGRQASGMFLEQSMLLLLRETLVVCATVVRRGSSGGSRREERRRLIGGVTVQTGSRSGRRRSCRQLTAALVMVMVRQRLFLHWRHTLAGAATVRGRRVILAAGWRRRFRTGHAGRSLTH